MAETAPNRFIAVDKKGGTVLLLDPDYGVRRVLDGFPKTPHELLVVPETERAYVPIFGDGIHGDNPTPGRVIAVIDLQAERRLADIDLGPLRAPHTLRLGPEGHLYVTCEDSGVVAIIDRASQAVLGTIETGSTNAHRLEIAPDQTWLCTENEEDASVSVIDLAAGRLQRQIATPQALGGVAITGAGQIVAVSDDEPVLFLIDPEAGEITETVPLKGAAAPGQIARFAPDFSLLAVTSMAGGTVSLMAPDFTGQTVLEVGAQPMDMAFVGGTLLVACQGDGTIHVVDLEARRVRQRVAAGVGCETIAAY